MSPSTDVASFHTYLSSARRIVALCGAGLSASSGLPTFRGAGGMWRNYDVMRLATPEAFRRDPGLVWQVRKLAYLLPRTLSHILVILVLLNA